MQVLSTPLSCKACCGCALEPLEREKGRHRSPLKHFVSGYGRRSETLHDGMTAVQMRRWGRCMRVVAAIKGGSRAMTGRPRMGLH